MSLFARIIFALTSFAPAWIVAAPFLPTEHYIKALVLCAAFGLIFVCWALLNHLSKSLQLQRAEIYRVDREDESLFVGLFSFAILTLTIAGGADWAVIFYLHAMLMLFSVVTHMPQINLLFVFPLGYKLYKMKQQNGMGVIVLSDMRVRRPPKDMQFVELTHGVYLHIREE